MWILEDEVVQMYNIMDQDICYCWSWSKFSDCCKKQTHPTRIGQDRFDANKNIFDKSWWILPTKPFYNLFNALNTTCFLCWGDSIKSHTVSDNWMRAVFSTSFVSCYKPIDTWWSSLQRTPINTASTFLWRCSSHDSSIFAPIDNNIDLSNNYHKNLLAYRWVWREYRLKQNMLKLFYSMFVLWGDKEQDWRILQLLIWAYQGMNDIQEMMTYIWNWISSMPTTWTWLIHKVFDLGNISPIFVSSAINTKNYNVCILTIYTNTNNQWYFIMSYKNWDSKSHELYKKIEKQKKQGELISFLNEIVSKNCENIVCDESRDWECVDNPWDLLSGVYESPIHEYIRNV